MSESSGHKLKHQPDLNNTESEKSNAYSNPSDPLSMLWVPKWQNFVEVDNRVDLEWEN
jgi:hypothetical protein